MGQRFKVERDMTPEDRKSFDDYLRSARPTVDEAYEHVLALGYTKISRSAVYGYMVSNEDQLNDLRAAAEGAKAWVDVARESGATGFGEAALTMLSQRVMQMNLEMQQSGEVDRSTVMDLALALQRITRSNATMTAIREVERKRAQEEAAAAISKAEQTVKAGGSPTAVVDAIKAALGFSKVEA